MQIGYLACCGVKEIQELRAHFNAVPEGEAVSVAWAKSARAAMGALCALIYPPVSRYVLDPNTGHNVHRPRERTWAPRCAHLIFTDHHDHRFAHKSKYVTIPFGKIFAKFILKNKLGTLACSRSKTNPNSNHQVTVWVWTLHDAAIKAYFNKEFPLSVEPDPVKIEPPVAPPTPEPVLPGITLTRPVHTMVAPPIRRMEQQIIDHNQQEGIVLNTLADIPARPAPPRPPMPPTPPAIPGLNRSERLVNSRE